MEKTETIHLLALVDSSHDAEVLASSLRNAGHAVRHKHIEDEEDLSTAIEQDHWDILISSPKVGDYPVEHCMEAINKLGKDIPCVVIHSGEHDTATALKYIQAGATDYIPASAQNYLITIVERELNHLYERRAHRKCRIALTESEKRNRSLLDSSRDSIAYIHEGMHIYTNLSYIEMFGYEDADELESIPIMDLIDADHQPSFKKVLRDLSQGDTPESEFEFHATRNDGEKFQATMSFSSASIDGEPCTQVVIHHQSDNKQLEKELDQLRKQDLLTGLYNRQHFMEEFSNAINWASKGESTSAMLYIEPDKFREIKDLLGIAGSDLVLTDMANIFKECVNSNAILARFAGTIFTIILPDTTQDEAVQIAEKIREKFDGHIFEVDGSTAETTLSIGVIPITETSPDVKKALNHADAACATAKGQGGNSVHVHTVADQLASLEEERAWAERVRIALTENSFVLHFQPIVSLHAEPGERYEVFIRMMGKENNIIPPNEFLPYAETAGLMGEIDRWVLKSAAKALLEKRRSGTEIRFFVKLSNDTLQDATFLPWLSKLLKAARLHGSSFVFEVSETTVTSNLKVAKSLAAGLHQLHCLFAIDHAGSEGSNLGYLSHLDVNYLKIDGSLIDNISQSEGNQETVKHITEVAREKDIFTIAQHVQDPTCLAVLWQHGVNFIQGFYLQQPEQDMAYDFTAEQ